MKFLISVILLSLCSASFAKDSKVINFLVAHRPHDKDHVELIQKFAKNIESRTQGRLKVQLHFKHIDEKEDLFKISPFLVFSGQFQMSQIPIDRMSEFVNTIDVLDFPMVFRDHAHAQEVLDGDIGRELMANMESDTFNKMKALAYTYSGGWRHIYTNAKEFNSLSDLSGERMRFRGSRSANDLFALLGVNLNFMSQKEFIEMHSAKGKYFEEAETNRIMLYRYFNPEMIKTVQTVIESKHSLYLTVLAMNGDFFRKLSVADQSLVVEETQSLAREERKLSIKQEIDGKKILEKQGVRFISLSEKDREVLQENASKIYQKYGPTHMSLIQRIKAIKDSKLVTH
ncbi:MAG: TRAP transporter substrate-binding protein [Bdellovibrio sp.]